MTAKEFVLSKYPDAFCKSMRNRESKQVFYQIYLTQNGKILSMHSRENWAWAEAKRRIIHSENQQP